MKKGKIINIVITIILGMFIFTACMSKTTTTDSVSEKETADSEEGNKVTTITEEQGTLEDKTLFVYCGAGMTKPFTDIVEEFQKETGATVEVTYANAAQIISQITVSNEGDLFIAGDKGELSAIQDEYVTDTKNLVKHIPIIAVQTGNPKGITALKDFAKEGVTVVLGDSKATPIGKISDRALTDTGIIESVNVIARTATAPEIATALSLGQCDAAIIWKENTKVEGVEAVETADMDQYIKTIPAASLKCSTNTEVLEAFLTYLDTDTAKGIWKSYGYELLN
ncbi:MAG: molybdate ABC transporter substrate-binding protein [Anaerocolumna sp.]